MNTIDDSVTTADLTNFQSGVNLGYSLGTWNNDQKVIDRVLSISNNNPQSPFCRGLNKGFEKTLLDKDKNQNHQFDERMSELKKTSNRDLDSKDIEI